MPKGKIQMQSCCCSFYKQNSQLKPHRYWMPGSLTAPCLCWQSNNCFLCQRIMWRLLNLPTQQIAMHYMHAERHMGGSLVYAGSWAQSLLPKPNYLCQQLRKSSTQGSSSKPDCWHSNSGTVWYRKPNHRRKCSFSQSDNHGPTRRPSLASCKKGAAYCKQFWIPSACQNSDPFTS